MYNCQISLLQPSDLSVILALCETTDRDAEGGLTTERSSPFPDTIDHGMIRPPGPRIGQRRVLQEAVVLDHRIVPHNSMGINVRPTASSSDIGQNEKEAMPSVRMLDRCRRTQSHRVRNVIQGTH